MVDPRAILATARLFAKTHSAEILTGIGVSGTLTTAYLSAKAAVQHKERVGMLTEDADRKVVIKETWDLWVPPVLSATVTVGAIVMSNHVSNQRLAAAYSVVAVTEKVLEEYKDKVVEQLGEKKERELRDEIVQDHVTNNPPSNQLVLIGMGGESLCMEMYTGRYFTSDVETLNRAVNWCNAKALRDGYCTMAEMHFQLGIPITMEASHLGWEAGKLLELTHHLVWSEDKRACIGFTYNYVTGL